MKNFPTTLLIAGACLSVNTFAISGVANGGDAVICNDPSLPPSEFHSLDYLLTHDPNEETISPDILVAKNAQDILKIIELELKRKSPDLGAHFEDFVSNVKNGRDWSKTRIWKAAHNSLVDLDDEALSQKLDRICLPSHTEDGSVEILQAVIRTKPGIIQYEYDSQILSSLEASQTPYQLSFLLVHEWLWDLSHNPKVIRNVNRYLHSTDFFNDSSEHILASLRGIGLKLEDIAFTELHKQKIAEIKRVSRLLEDAFEESQTGGYSEWTSLQLGYKAIEIFDELTETTREISQETRNFVFAQRLQTVVRDLMERGKRLKNRLR